MMNMNKKDEYVNIRKETREYDEGYTFTIMKATLFSYIGLTAFDR